MDALKITGRLISLGTMNEDDWRSLSSEVHGMEITALSVAPMEQDREDAQTAQLISQAKFLRQVAAEIRKDGHAGWGNTCEGAADAIDAAARAHAQDREDALRYRWLREQLLAADFMWGDPPQPVLVFKWPSNVGVGGNCDQNIDAARQAPKEPTP